MPVVTGTSWRKTYSSPNNLCLEVHDSEGPLLIATTNIAGYHCDSGNVLIKNWSENQGVYEALLAAGVIGPVIRKVPNWLCRSLRVQVFVGLTWLSDILLSATWLTQKNSIWSQFQTKSLSVQLPSNKGKSNGIHRNDSSVQRLFMDKFSITAASCAT